MHIIDIIKKAPLTCHKVASGRDRVQRTQCQVLLIFMDLKFRGPKSLYCVATQRYYEEAIYRKSDNLGLEQGDIFYHSVFFAAPNQPHFACHPKL